MPELEPIPAFSDNYIWLLTTPPARAAVAVDPGDAAPVLETLGERQLDLVAILLTHHHGDHVGGVDELVRRHAVPVYGPARENISGVRHPVADGDSVHLAEIGVELEVIDVPGHTAGHIAYLGPGFALVGDTLFAGGCGRVFEGTLEQMYSSLNRLAALEPATRIYCAHEYTVANLRFALQVEPGNDVLVERLDAARTVRAKGLPTVPSTIAEELATNPFLRCTEPAVAAAAEARAGCEVPTASDAFAVIRGWKDGWSG
jgi:hydroxyacylglutathione hydrolase